jgi:hypothetical protein
MGQEGGMFIDQARLHTINWRKLGIAFGLALAVVAVILGTRWIAG